LIIDIGAQINILTKTSFENLDVSRELRKAGTKLTGYTDYVSPADGFVELPFTINLSSI